MRTLDEQNTRSFSLWTLVVRDTKLLLKIASMAKDYFTTGAAIRRSYREKQRRGETYFVDGRTDEMTR